jgi:hypothetical protein
MLYTRRYRLMAQALAGYDASPTSHDEGLWHWGGFIEGNVRVTSSLVGVLRLDHVRTASFDDRSEGGATHVRRRIWEVTGGFQFLLDENVKIVAEATYGENSEAVGDVTVQSWSTTVRLVTSFWPLTPPLINRWLGPEGSS